MYVSHRSICHGWTRLIPPPSSFGVSTGEILTAVPPVSKCRLLSRACRLLLLRLPLIPDRRAARTPQGRYRRNRHHVKELSFGSGKCRNRTCGLSFFPLLRPVRGRGSLAPRRCPLPGAVIVVWFDFGEGYLHIASTKVPIAATCRRMRALALASFWHSSP